MSAQSNTKHELNVQVMQVRNVQHRKLKESSVPRHEVKVRDANCNSVVMVLMAESVNNMSVGRFYLLKNINLYSGELQAWGNSMIVDVTESCDFCVAEPAVEI